ncbi:RDD family protein [Nocardia sp. NPDC003693]
MNYPGGVPRPYAPHGQFHDGTPQPVPPHGAVHPPYADYTQTPYGAPPAYGPGAQNNWNAGPPPVYAGWAARVGAALLDGAMISIPAAVLVSLALTVGVESRSCGLQQQLDGSFQPIDCGGGGLSGVGVALLSLTLLLVIGAGFFLVYREGVTGQTPGKKALGIRLVRESTAQPLGFGAALGRRLCHVVDSAVCYLGYLWPLWDGKKQTFADKIIGSVVVRRL